MPAAPARRLQVAGVLLAAIAAALAGWLLLGGGAAPPAGEVSGKPVAAVPPSPALPGLPVRIPPPPAPPASPPLPAPASALPLPQEPEPPADPPDPLAVPLRAVLRDGTTGRAVAGASLVLLAGSEGKRLPLRADGERHLLGASPLRRGESASLHFEARLPAGYVTEWKDSLWATGTVAVLAAEVEAVLVVWPEARVRLRVEEEDGSPARGAVLRWASAGAGIIEPSADPTDSRGETLIRGVPSLRGERVRAAAGIGDRWGFSAAVLLPAPGEECLVRVVLPRVAPGRSASGVGGGGAGGMFDGRRGGGRAVGPVGHAGALTVRVLRRDGRPAPGVRVFVESQQQAADDEGNARFQAVAAGARLVSVREPGFYADPVTVSVVAGTEAFAELRQCEGAAIDFRVLDADGLPAAGASLEVTLPDGLPYCLMEGDTQVLGLHADADGRARLPGLPPGTVRVKARLGTRSAEVVSPGGGPLEIRLPPAN